MANQSGDSLNGHLYNFSTILPNGLSGNNVTLLPFVSMNFMGYIAALISILALLGSIQSVILLWSDKRQHRSTKVAFTNLAAASFGTGVGLALSSYTILVGAGSPLHTKPYKWICEAMAFEILVSIRAFPGTHAAIAINRLFYVVLGDRFPGLKSRTTQTLLVVTPWLLSLMTFVWPLFGIGGVYGFASSINRCTVTRSDIYFTRFCRIFFTLSSFMIMIVSYGAVLVKVYLSAHRLSQHQSYSHSQAYSTKVSPSTIADSSDTGMSKRPVTPGAPAPPHVLRKRKLAAKISQRVTKVAVVACAVFFVCHLPSTLQSFTAKSLAQLQEPLGQSLSALDWFGIAISPWITACASTELRRRWYSCWVFLTGPFFDYCGTFEKRTISSRMTPFKTRAESPTNPIDQNPLTETPRTRF